MGLKQSFPYNVIPKNNYTYEEVTALLQGNEVEQKVIPINPYCLPYYEYLEEDLVFLSTVDADVYEKVFLLLLDEGLEVHCEAICSILKDGYVQELISGQNSIDLYHFNNELKALNILLKKSEIHQLAFIGGFETEDKVILKDKLLLKTIINNIKDLITSSSPYVLNVRKRNIGSQQKDGYTNQALFNLLFFFIKETNFINPPINFKNPKIENKLSVLIGELFFAGFLEIKDGRERQDVAKLMRNKIERLITNNSRLESYLQGDYGFGSDNNEDIDTLNNTML